MGAPFKINDPQKKYIINKIGINDFTNLEKSLSYDSTQAFQHDGKVWNTYLTSPSSGVEQEKKEIVNRLFYVLADPNIKIHTPNHQQKSAQESQLTLAALLSHGGRVLIQVPPTTNKDENPDQFFEWVIGGKKRIAERKGFKSSPDDSKPVFSRTFATHGVKINDSIVEETRPKPNVKHPGQIIPLIKGYAYHRHFGLNVGLGNEIHPAKANGENGHVYMYWQAPTQTKPGALLVGCENSAPGCTDKYGQAHTAKAVSGNISPTGARKYRGFEDKNELPRELGGVTLELDRPKLNNIMKTSQEKINNITTKLSTSLNRLFKHQSDTSFILSNIATNNKNSLNESMLASVKPAKTEKSTPQSTKFKSIAEEAKIKNFCSNLDKVKQIANNWHTLTNNMPRGIKEINHLLKNKDFHPDHVSYKELITIHSTLTGIAINQLAKSPKGDEKKFYEAIKENLAFPSINYLDQTFDKMNKSESMQKQKR